MNESTLVCKNKMFTLSSVFKTVTATALIYLFQDQLFTFNNNINDYLSFDITNLDYLEVPITFKIFLAHLSEIKDNRSDIPF